MKKYIIGLAFFAFGCGTKSASKITEDIVTDSTKAIGALTNSTNNESEDFNEFFKKFTTDSLFQIERVKFPWTIITWESGEDAPVKKLINKEDWRFSSFHYESNYATRQIDAYTQETKSYADSAKIELRGVDNGIHIDFVFYKVNGLWALVSEKDYSN